MALTFVNLQDKVLGWMDAGDHTSADSELLTRVKEALVEADVERATEQRWPFMVQEPALSFPLVAGTRTYALDTSFHVPIYFWNRTQGKPLTQFPIDDVPSRDYIGGGLIDDYLVSSPQYSGYTLRNQSITLQWTPTGADVIDYSFYKLPVEMSADADLPNITYPHSRILIYDALLRLATYDEDMGGAKINEWKERQTKHENNLLAAHGQDNSQWTNASYVTYIPRD